jgi:dTDP-4-amino-4,6-dideoxy-D-galactose acyltransferase
MKKAPKEHNTFFKLSKDVVSEDKILSTTGSIRVKTTESEIRCELLDKEGQTSGVVLIEKSKWDTEHFGVGIGTLKRASFEDDIGNVSQRELFQNAKITSLSQGLAVIFARVPLHDFSTIQVMEAEGAVLTDVLLTFTKDLDHNFVCKNHVKKIKIGQASLSDEEALRNIAREVFRVDHFHADSRLSREKCDDVYSEWISNSLRGLANIVFVARKGDSILGFVTCKCRIDQSGNQKGFIDLIGVRNEYTGHGIGSFLVSKSLEWFSGKACCVLAGTQAANVPAVRLYQKMGFRHIFSEATLHLWTSPR